jgi:hypothetical protein
VVGKEAVSQKLPLSQVEMFDLGLVDVDDHLALRKCIFIAQTIEICASTFFDIDTS